MATDKIKKLEKELKALNEAPSSSATERKKIDILNDLAFEFHTIKPDETESHGRRALAMAERISYKKGVARSNTVIGISFWIRGDYDSALKYFNKCIKYYNEISDKKGIAESYGNIAGVNLRQGNYEKALRYNFKAINIFKKLNHKAGMGRAYNSVGIIYGEQGDYERSLKYKLLALKIAEEIGDKEQSAIYLCNVAGLFAYQDDLDSALAYFLKAIKAAEEIGNKQAVATCYDNIGCVYFKMHSYKKALEHCLHARKLIDEIGDKEGLGRVCNNIAQIYSDEGNYEKAIKYQLISLTIFEEIGNQRGIGASYMNLADLHMQMNDTKKSLDYLNKGANILQTIDAKELLLQSHKLFSEIFASRNQFKRALNYFKKYSELEKEVFNAGKNKQITEMKTRYETEKKEKEAEIYRLKTVELRKEVKQRKKAEKELKQHQDHLEDLVAERTCELEKENAERRRAEQELLRHQEQLRSLTREISLIEEKQRRKFATFLHDDISQALALAAFKLRSIDEMGSVKDVRKEAKKVKKVIDETIERARALAFEISPPVLYELGLEPALEWLVRRFGKQYRLSAQFKDDGITKPITDDARVFLFQSVRELLSNVTRHSRAKSVMVSACKNNNSICITVADDGIGFDAGTLDTKIAKNEGFGLFNVRERLRNINGQIEIRSKKGEGTSVILNVPLAKKQRRKKGR